MPKIQKVLLSFTGFHDPYGDSPLEGAREAGPILQMLACRPFDHVVLFQTPRLAERTAQTVAEMARLFPAITVAIKPLDRLDDPTDHIRILKYLRRFVREILGDHPKADFSVSNRRSPASTSPTTRPSATPCSIAASAPNPSRLPKT